MEVKLRQRVIGALVLIALAVIFIPLLFRMFNAHVKPLIMAARIPAAPSKPGVNPTVIVLPDDHGNQQTITITNNNTVANSDAVNTPSAAPTVPVAPAASAGTSVVTDTSSVVNASPAINANVPDNNINPAAVPAVVKAAESEPAVKPVDFKPVSQESMATVPENKATTEEPVVGKAWVVELGTFANIAHATALQKQLQAKDFTVYLHTTTSTAGKTLTHVLVGPEVDRAKADALLARLNGEMHMKGLVIPFNPLDNEQK